MTTSVFAVKPEGLASDQTETRHFAPHEAVGDAAPRGDLIVKYRSCNLDRFVDVPAAVAGKIIEKVHDSRNFMGTLAIEGADCIGVINMDEVESIIFRQDQGEAQS